MCDLYHLIKVFLLVVSSSTTSQQKLYGKKATHTSKSRVGRITKDTSNGEDSNQGNQHTSTHIMIIKLYNKCHKMYKNVLFVKNVSYLTLHSLEDML